MVDNVKVKPSDEPSAFKMAVDKIADLVYPIYKIAFGGEDSATQVSKTNPLPVGFSPDSPNLDAFGRLRVSMPKTLFDFKQNHANSAMYFDDQEVTGAGTGSTYTKARASTTIDVSAATAGLRVRQTFMRFNYQPGKSHMVLMTGILAKSGGGAGITRGWGYGNSLNGFFVYDNEGTIALLRRSSVTGSLVETVVNQSAWNIDTLDGSGASGITLDPSKTQILFLDMEWLGVGRVRMGFNINGTFIVVHSFDHANVEDVAYISNPNLPMRYWIENDGTGVASELEHICSTVMSEGGEPDVGVHRSQASEAAFINANAAGSYYAIFGIRLTAADLDGIVSIIDVIAMNSQADDYHWELRMNPTLAGAAPSWNTLAESTVEYAIADTVGSPSVNTVTGGYIVESGYVKGGNQAGDLKAGSRNQLRLGSAIDGTPDEFWLVVMPLTANADIYGGLTWREVN